jgi:hypothetical protein
MSTGSAPTETDTTAAVLVTGRQVAGSFLWQQQNLAVDEGQFICLSVCLPACLSSEPRYHDKYEA